MESPSVEEPASLTALEQHLAVASDPCPMCSYNLHKLKGSNCPECGYALVLRVAVPHPRMAAFYTGLIGLAAGAGFTSVLLLWGLLALFMYGGPEARQVVVLLIEAVTLGSLTVLWFCFSGWIRRLPGPRRWGMAVGACALSVFAAALFVVVSGL